MGERQNVRLDFEANGVGRMRNEVRVSGSFGGEWQLATDEGKFHGGEETAPPPLAYFATALAGCFLTQVRAFAKRLDIELRAPTATGWVEWWLETDGRQPYTSGPLTFGVELRCDSPATSEQLLDLIGAAQLGCFVEQSLVGPVLIKHSLVHNGHTVEIT